MDVLRHTARGSSPSWSGRREQRQPQDGHRPAQGRGLHRGRAAADDRHGRGLRRHRGRSRSSRTCWPTWPASTSSSPRRARTPPRCRPSTRPPGDAASDWKPTDTAAVASLIGGIFGRGGGAETQVAAALRAAQKRFGASQAAPRVRPTSAPSTTPRRRSPRRAASASPTPSPDQAPQARAPAGEGAHAPGRGDPGPRLAARLRPRRGGRRAASARAGARSRAGCASSGAAASGSTARRRTRRWSARRDSTSGTPARGHRPAGGLLLARDPARARPPRRRRRHPRRRVPRHQPLRADRPRQGLLVERDHRHDRQRRRVRRAAVRARRAAPTRAARRTTATRAAASR